MTTHSRRQRGEAAADAPVGLAMRRRRNGRYGPVLLCGACGRAIADARTGVVLWNCLKQDAPPTFAHVGACCRQLEEATGDALDSVPLSAWLIYLSNGCKLHWLKAGKLAVALPQVG